MPIDRYCIASLFIRWVFFKKFKEPLTFKLQKHQAKGRKSKFVPDPYKWLLQITDQLMAETGLLLLCR
jgi:hypothetical protein